MSNKQIIKKVFDEEFDSNKMRQQILLSYEKKGKNNMFKILKYAIPVCVITMICGVLVLGNHSSLMKPSLKEKNYDNDIIVNKVGNLGVARLDADMKTIPSNGIGILWPNILKDGITIPKDLDKDAAYAVFTREDKTGEYDILNCYVYEYYKEDSTRSVRMSFSDNNKPIRDYYFSEEGSKKSSINHHELTIYQYEEVYFTEFKYEGYHFDIETSNITFEEFISLLISIIK